MDQEWRSILEIIKNQSCFRVYQVQNIFMNICILQAKWLISLNWKSIYAPNIGRWLKETVTYVNGNDNLYIKR